MFKNSWLGFALCLAVPIASVAEEKRGDSRTGVDLHPNCVEVFDNLVANCGFEVGSFEGWERSGDLSNTVVTGDAAHSGSFGAAFSPPGLGFIAQTLPTDPGLTYTISIWLKTLGQPNEFQLFWDGNLIADLVNIGDTVYTQFTYQGLSVASTMTELKLGFSNLTGFLYLDDVVVQGF